MQRIAAQLLAAGRPKGAERALPKRRHRLARAARRASQRGQGRAAHWSASNWIRTPYQGSLRRRWEKHSEDGRRLQWQAASLVLEGRGRRADANCDAHMVQIPRAGLLRNLIKWTHWDLNPGPSACEADVIPLHHAPNWWTMARVQTNAKQERAPARARSAAANDCSLARAMLSGTRSPPHPVRAPA